MCECSESTLSLDMCRKFQMLMRSTINKSRRWIISPSLSYTQMMLFTIGQPTRLC
ncbi:unnamed protein product [Blumeria hordei]|uniref:Uncharacterized protein n=1 Tax=Blumeria hordei TaxID=2867405 RepID=A0A383UXX6_BLUHO|nr:unnamed protein product [Blumeria hordei]